MIVRMFASVGNIMDEVDEMDEMDCSVLFDSEEWAVGGTGCGSYVRRVGDSAACYVML